MGREKTETTFRFTQNGNQTISDNWGQVNLFLQIIVNETESIVERLDSGFLIRNVPVQQVINLISEWSSAPHSQSGYNLFQLSTYIQLMIGNDELTSWSIYLPSRSADNDISMRDFYDGLNDFAPLEDQGEFGFLV